MKRLRKGLLLTLLALCVAFGAMIAGCAKKKVMISFDLNGASTTYESIEVAAGEEFILKIPEREGFEFTGWYDNQALTGTPIMGGSVKAPDTDTTYYASWAELMTVTLEGGGGKFSDGSETMEVKIGKGKALLEALNDYIPTRGTLRFGAWFMGGNTEVTEDTKMPGRSIVLTAKYEVSYSVEVFTQVSTAEGYQHDTSKDFTDFGYVDEDFTVPAPEIEGFEFFRNHPNAKVSGKLLEDSSQNQFRLYYNKQTYTIIYDVNAPASTSFSGFMADQKILRDEEGYAMECGYTIRAYRFAGWAKTASARDVEFNPGDVLPEGNYTLYAIWDAGYSDIFGGSDCIYFPHEGKNGTAYLQRGNVEIEGKTKNRDAEGNYTDSVDGMYVVFTDSLIAKLVDSNPKSFSFLDEDMAGEYSYYNPYYIADGETEKKSDKTLKLDGFDGAELTEEGSTKKYNFSLDEETGYYKIENGSESRFVVLGKEEDKKVFTLVGSEFGSFQQFVRVSGVNYAYGNYVLNLDGLGNASWTLSALATTVRGKYEELTQENNFDFVKVHLDDGSDLEFIFLPFEGLTAIAVKDNFAEEYTFVENGEEKENSKLILDGFDGYTGRAKHNNAIISYFLQDTIFGTIANVINANGSVTKFKLNKEAKTFEAINENYTIYRYFYMLSDGTNTVGDYYLVVYEADGGEMQSAKVVKGNGTTLYEGKIDAEEHAPLYSFEVDKKETTDSGFSFDKGFRFYTTDKFTVGLLFYVYLEQDPNSTEVNATYMYMESDNGNGPKLLVYTGLNTYETTGVQGIGSFVVEPDGKFVEGSLDNVLFDENSISDTETYFGIYNYYIFTYYTENFTLAKRYFAIYMDGEEVETATFTVEELQDEPRVLAEAYSIMDTESNSPFAMEISLYLNGKGEARYMMITAEGKQFVKCSYVSMGNVAAASNLPGYRLKVNDPKYSDVDGQEIELVISGLSPNYYYVHNQFMEGNNPIANGGRVELDGWGTHAYYVDNFGHEYEGYYCFYPEHTSMLIYPNMQTAIVQVSIVDGAFVNTPPELGGMQGGLWTLVDQNFEPYFEENAAANFDGQGGVIIEDLYAFMNWNINGGDKNIYGLERKIYGKGFYTAISETEYELEVGFYDEEGNLDYTERWTAKLSNGMCIKLGSSSLGSYIQDEDKAVVYLDGYGEGFYIDGRGNREDGEYHFLDEENGIVLFLNADVIYLMEVKNIDGARTMKILNAPDKYKTFYADDLSAVEFGETLKIDGMDVGLWYFDESDNFVFYEFTETEGIKKSDTYKYGNGNTYEVEAEDGTTKTYKLWDPTKPVTYALEGNIIFRALEEKGYDNSKIEGAKLTFTPDGTTNINATASLTFTDFGNDAKSKTYENVYTLQRVLCDSIEGSSDVYASSQLLLCYGDMQFAIKVDTKENTFNLWANINAAGIGNDLLIVTGEWQVSAATLSLGFGYTLGVITWDLDHWGDEYKDEILIGGRVNAVDKNGDLIYYEVFWDDYENKAEKVIGYTTQTGVAGDIPVYEIFTKNLDGKSESVVLLEVLPAGSTVYYVLYASCNIHEVAEVCLPNNENTASDKTEDFKVTQLRVISTTKGFDYDGVAYSHVYKKLDAGAEQKQDPHAPQGFESISTGYCAYVKSQDMILVNGKDVTAGKRVFALTPKHLDKDKWDYDHMTLWFGVSQSVSIENTDKKDDPLFEGVTYMIIFLTNEYRPEGTTATAEQDTRKILDAWLVYYYINDGKGDVPYSFLEGYAEDGRTRITRVTAQDKKTMYNLKFSGTMNNPEVKHEEYTPPKEETDKEDGE